ncbi:MAG: hypothetical protein HY645_03535 [Acidobacteria bacterium]|nr:hypothetical protein [Acidobacteriota bacterium]
MNCKEASRQLTRHEAGRHDPDLVAHLQKCAKCRALSEDLTKLSEWARQLFEGSETPPDFSHRVPRGVRHASARGFFWKPALAVTCLVVGCSLALFWTFMSFTPSELQVADSDPSYAEESPTTIVIDSEPRQGTGDTLEMEEVPEFPSRIEFRESKWHRDFYIRNVSH